MMVRKNVSMIATAIALALALPAGALAQDNSGNGPAVVSPLQLPGTATAPQAQVPQPQADPGVNWKGVGVGAGTVVGNALYIPAKLVYGILGGVAGGAGWALTGGNTQVANTIWRSSLGGDYVLTPNMVAGQEPIHFSGPITTAPRPQTQALSPLPTAPQASAGYPSTYSSGPTSMSTAPPAGGSSGGAHPMDSGAGPIGGNGSSRMSGPLPSTSIQ
jgi:hypothetical protein